MVVVWVTDLKGNVMDKAAKAGLPQSPNLTTTIRPSDAMNAIKNMIIRSGINGPGRQRSSCLSRTMLMCEP